MKKLITLLFSLLPAAVFALDGNHFIINRITAPYFIVDGNSPATLTKAYVGFEVKNNSNSATTYNGLKFTITSISTTVAGQNYSVVAPATGIINVGTLAPGETKLCYYYVAYPANVTPQATFNITLSDNTAGTKTQSFVIRNRSSISANAGGAATQSFTNQDLIGGLIIDDVTYVVGNVQNGDESDFQVAVSSQFDPTKISLLSTEVISSTVPGIAAGTTDSLYFITGNGSTGASVTIRWRFRITGTNFTNYLLPCAGSTSGSTNYKYALNTSLGQGSPITVSSSANPLTISKTSDRTLYGTNAPAIFTVTIQNPGAYGVTIDKITDELPAGFSFQAIDGTSQVTAANSTVIPAAGSTGTIVFEGGVFSGGNNSYYIPPGGSIILKYSALSASSSASNLLTTAKDYVGTAEVGSATNIVSVSSTLPVSLIAFRGGWLQQYVQLDWTTLGENNSEQTEIERSNGNNLFTVIGHVKAAGNTNLEQAYTFIDSFPAAGKNLYRIKLLDKDGRYQYSPVITVSNTKNESSVLKAYPNPFSNNLAVEITLPVQQQAQLQLTDLSGRIILQRSVSCKAGSNLLMLKETDPLPAGTYLMRIVTKDRILQQKIVKGGN